LVADINVVHLSSSTHFHKGHKGGFC
jgi:hypothetical protein